MENVKEINEVREMALSVPETARMIVAIKTDDDYVKASNILLTIKEIRKKIEQTFKPIKQRLDAAKKEVIEQERAADKPLVDAESYLKPLMAQYVAEQERKRREEERKLQEKLRREEEERIMLEALKAEALEGTEAAEAVLESAPQIPPVVLPKMTPKVNGISMREVWKFRIVDESLIPREFLKPDEVKIGGYVRSMKSSAKIPGVEIYREKSVVAGTI